MPESEIDLLSFERGSISAPAGCGKTHSIADALTRLSDDKPALVLTHTNAGVAALRGKLDRANVPRRAYRLATLDGWAIRLLGLFPMRAGIDPNHLLLANPAHDYPAIRLAAASLMESGHISDMILASYSRLIVDEYQDCNRAQHALVHHTAAVLRTVVLGDPLQAIFGWPGNALADWATEVCVSFPLVGELSTPWRWRRASTETLGRWLLEIRRDLLSGRPVQLTSAPAEVSWVHLDGREDQKRQINAGHARASTSDGGVLIIGDSRVPASQQEFAARVHGAVTVEAVDLKDLLQFANTLKFHSPDALANTVAFAALVMTNIGATAFLRRVAAVERGSERKPPSDAESAALRFKSNPSPRTALVLLVELGRQAGVRTHRPAILRACLKALEMFGSSSHGSFLEAVIHVREQGRVLGRALPQRAVGSTLLLKGLEAEVAVILDADKMNKQNLYVAMTRGSKRLIICSASQTLSPRP